jgi:hypothetical protein
VSRRHHPAERSRRVRQVVTDNTHLAEWWATERATARREEATTRLLHTLAWCAAALTATVVVVTLLDAVRGA